MIDFMRALDDKNLNDGKYVVIAVQDNTFEPTEQTKYFKNCKRLCWRSLHYIYYNKMSDFPGELGLQVGRLVRRPGGPPHRMSNDLPR